MTNPLIVAVGPVSILIGLALRRLWEERRARRTSRRLAGAEAEEEGRHG